jgi:hypothetical protein
MTTAFDLIDSIFARAPGMGDVRVITPKQLNFLRDLIGKDPERGAVKRGGPGSMIWTPRGHPMYVITEDPMGGEKHTLARSSNLQPSGEGKLFDY